MNLTNHLMKLSIHWLGRDNATVTFSDDRVTIESSLLNVTEQAELANHLREIADTLSPSAAEDFDD